METSDLDIAAKHYAIGWQDCEQFCDDQRLKLQMKAIYHAMNNNDVEYDGRVSANYLEEARWWQSFWRYISLLLAIVLVGSLFSSWDQKTQIGDKDNLIASLRQEVRSLGGNPQ